MNSRGISVVSGSLPYVVGSQTPPTGMGVRKGNCSNARPARSAAYHNPMCGLTQVIARRPTDCYFR